MPGAPPFSVILLAQGLSAGSELFGQRVSRRVHHLSNIRMLISMAVWCSIQAFVVLSIGEYVLPTSLTGGQGAISMWSSLAAHPELLLNAVNNSVYWVALVYCLKEPLGAVLVVLAFLSASFLVDPFGDVVGLSNGGHIPPGSVVLGVLGAVFCVLELPLPMAQTVLRRLCGDAPGRCSAAGRKTVNALQGADGAAPVIAADAERELELEAAPAAPALTHAEAQPAGAQQPPADRARTDDAEDGERVPLMRFSPSAAGSRPAAGSGSDAASGAPVKSSAAIVLAAHTQQQAQLPNNDGVCACCSSGGGASNTASQLGHAAAVLVAFGVLALTTGVGITLTTYMQAKADLSAFGYTAVDQVLLPLTTLPLAWALERILPLRRLVGEPPWPGPLPQHGSGQQVAAAAAGDERSPSFAATLRRTWAEVWTTPRQLCPEDGEEEAEVAGAASGAQAATAPSSVRSTAPSQQRGACGSGCAAACARLLPGPLRRPWPFVATLAAFHGLEFLRTFLFFWLVTRYDTDVVYLQMTLVRIALVGAVSLLACTLLRRWVGLRAAETAAAMHPVNLATRGAGSLMLVLSILVLKGMI